MTGQTAIQLAPTLHRPSAYRRLVTAHGSLRVNLTLGLLIALIVLGLIAPLLPLQDPIKPDPFNSLKAPSADHWFGTDPNGFDIFSRTIHAIRTDFALSVSSVLIGVLIGVPLGAISGYFGGVIDNVINRISEVIQGFPQLLFGMAVLAVAGNTLVNVVLITAFYNVPVYAKMVRSVVLPLRDVEFVQAARLAGNSPLSVVFRHIIPNALLPVVSQFPLSCAYAVQMIAGLSFIGLGVQIPTPEWGSMIQQGANYIVFSKWWPSVFPGLALVFSVSLLSSLSDQLKVLVTRRA
jgi:peptide/nickel transport system permease protein